MSINFKSIKIDFKCSYKLIPLSLDKLSELFLKKSKKIFPYKILNENTLKRRVLLLREEHFNTPADYKNFYIENKKLIINTRELVREYCESDVWLLAGVLNKYFLLMKSWNISIKNCYTASSISINLYYKIFNKITKKYNTTIDNYIREGYFGGRCEVFGNAYKNEQILHYDFKGMYAQCMLERVPINQPKLEYPSEIVKPGFYKIKFKQNLDIPILPIKNDKLYFANGVFIGTYWYEEIQLFQRSGGEVCEIYSAYTFDTYDYGLSDFVNMLSRFRDYDPIAKHIGKLLINSFYGRLGMGSDNYKTIISQKIPTDTQSYTKIDDYFIYNKIDNNIKVQNVAVAAAITSKARVKLYNAYIDVINNGGRLLYSDTDSIVAAFPNEINILDKNLGSIMFDSKISGTVIKKAVFASSKSYSIILPNNKTYTKIKGFSQNSVSFNKFKYYFFNKRTLIIKNQVIFSKKKYEIFIKTTEKQINFENYTKRIFTENYHNTKPISIVYNKE